MSQSKRKWKVYTSTELRDRFQPKTAVLEDKDEKVDVPNLSKRRNSAPPGMIHFPPGTFSASANSFNNHNHNNNNNNNNNPFSSSPSSPPQSLLYPSSPSNGTVPSTYPQQHSLVTHAKVTTKPSFSSPYPPPKLERRRASLPHILNPPSFPSHHNHSPVHSEAPSIEHYFQHIQQSMPQRPIDLDHADKATRTSFTDEVKEHLSTTAVERQILPSFQALLQTIREEREEEDVLELEPEDELTIDPQEEDVGDDFVPTASETRHSMEISQLLSK